MTSTRACLCIAALSLAAATGCPSPLSSTTVSGNAGGVGSCSTCGKHPATGGNGSGGRGPSGASGGSSGGTSGAAGGSSGGTASQGTSGGGSTSGGSGGCGGVAGEQGTGIFDCSSPQLVQGGPPGCTTPYFASTVQDVGSCGAICGAEVQMLDQSGAPIAGASGLSDPGTGIVQLCMPGSYTYTPSVSVPGYPLFYYGEIQDQLSKPINGLGMISDETIMAIGGLIPGFNQSLATLVLYTYTYGTLAQCADSVGWNVAIELPDGGPWPDGGYTVFYSQAGTGYPDSTLTATTQYGVAIVTNVDPSVSSLVRLVLTNPNAGACSLQNEALGFTGLLRVGNGDFSAQAILLP